MPVTHHPLLVLLSQPSFPFRGTHYRTHTPGRPAMLYDAVELYNVQELLNDERGEATVLTRLPNALQLTLNDFARDYALQTAGCEIRFNLVGDRAMVQLHIQVPHPLAPPAIVEI